MQPILRVIIPAFALFFHPVWSMAQTGVIKGNIQSAKNEPLSGINVGLEGTALGSPTDDQGSFVIKDVPAGTYALKATGVGYTATKQNITVSPGRTLELNLQLSENQTELQEVVVTAFAPKGYEQQKIASIATRSEVPLLETPQAVQVIPNQLWKDQTALNVNEVARNMVGVANNLPYNSFSMRGFDNYYPGTFMTFNGLRGNLYHYSQKVLLYNVEQMEVLRGPASVLYSTGNPGGIINVNTKQPLDKARYEINFTTGSWNLFTGFLDATGPLTADKKLKYRVVIGGEDSKSYRNFQYAKNLLINPTLRYEFSKKTALTVEYANLRMDSQFEYDRGTLVKKKADGSYDYDGADRAFTTQGEASSGKDRNWSASLNFSHRFTDKVSFTLMSRYVNRKLDMLEASALGELNATQDSIPRYGDTWNFHNTWLSTTAYFSYKFDTGKWFSHTLLAGADVIEERWLQNLYVSKTFPTLSIRNPDFSQDGSVMNNPAIPIDYSDNNTYVIHNNAGFIQDQIGIGKRLKVNLALRYNTYSYRQQPVDALDFTGTEVESDATAWVPRAGLVLMPKENLAFYGSYTESFEPQDANNRGGGGPFAPKRGKQFEVGYKGDFLQGRLSTSVAVYTIRYVNVLATDPADPQRIRQILVPGLTSRGIELLVQGNLTNNFSVVANYAYNKVSYLANSPLGNENDRPFRTPEYVGNVWLKYTATEKLFRGLGIGAGVTFQGNQIGGYSRDNALPVPGFAYVNTTLHYRFDNYSLGLNVNNLLDEKYFVGSYGQALMFPGSPRNFRLNIAAVF